MSSVTQRQSGSQSPSRKAQSQDELDRQKEVRRKAAAAQQKRNKKSVDIFNDYGYHIVIGVFILVCVIAIGATFFKGSRKLEKTPVINQAEIDAHNADSSNSFTIGANDMFDSWMMSDAKGILNTQLTTKSSLHRCASQEASTIIPDSFNWREKFGKCQQQIVNQGNCSSSYAIAGASVISDRFCQVSDGAINVNLSPQQLIACDSGHSLGCKGGHVSRTFDVAKRTGLYDSGCWRGYTPNDFANDATCQFGDCEPHKITDYCVSNKEEGIKKEIIENGPVVSVIPIYKDFLTYKSGIYTASDSVSKFSSGHALKIIGWDQTNSGKKYWIVENSWGESWGQNGLAYIAIGQDNLLIDEFAISPVPTYAKPGEATDSTTDSTTTQ